MTLIKICGITSVQDALEVASLKVDMIGLVFAESSRRISRETACEITAALRETGLTPGRSRGFRERRPADDQPNSTRVQAGYGAAQRR